MPVIVSMALKGVVVDNNSRETPVVFGCSSDDQTPRYHLVRHRQVWGQVWKSTWFIQTLCKYVVITELWYISVVYYTRWFLQHGLLRSETGASGTADMWLLMGGRNSSMFRSVLVSVSLLIFFYLHSFRTSEITLEKKPTKHLWQSNIHKHRCGELIGRVGNCTFMYLWRITVSFWSLFVEHLEINHSCNYVPDQKTKLVNNIKEDYPWIYVSPKPWGTESGESCLLCSYLIVLRTSSYNLCKRTHR